MTNPDPLHGVTLKTLLTDLVDKYGWQELGERITIKCFTNDPSISSSLKFLRRTPWARNKVETLYIESLTLNNENHHRANHQKGNHEKGNHQKRNHGSEPSSKTTSDTNIWPTSK